MHINFFYQKKLNINSLILQQLLLHEISECLLTNLQYGTQFNINQNQFTMIRLAIQQLKSSFAIIPERSNRFFSLSIQTNLESPISQILQEQHKKYIEASQSTGALLLAYQIKEKNKQNVKYSYLFQSPNEVEAYSFAKGSPFKGYIANILIQQIEMQRRIRDKQLAPKYLRE